MVKIKTKKLSNKENFTLRLVLGGLVAAAVVLAGVIVVRNFIGISISSYSWDSGVANPDLLINSRDTRSPMVLGVATSENELAEITNKYLKSGLKTTDKENLNQGRDFVENNYLVLGYVDTCSDDYDYDYAKMLGGSLKIHLTHKISCGYCALTGIFLFIEIPKDVTSSDQIFFDIEERNSCRSEPWN